MGARRTALCGAGMLVLGVVFTRVNQRRTDRYSRGSVYTASGDGMVKMERPASVGEAAWAQMAPDMRQTMHRV